MAWRAHMETARRTLCGTASLATRPRFSQGATVICLRRELCSVKMRWRWVSPQNEVPEVSPQVQVQ
jgi:hypothetical protein